MPCKPCLYRPLQRNLKRSRHLWFKRVTKARSDAHHLTLGRLLLDIDPDKVEEASSLLPLDKRQDAASTLMQQAVSPI